MIALRQASVIGRPDCDVAWFFDWAHTAGDENKGVAWFHYPPYTANFYTHSTRIGVTLRGPLVMLKKE